jgi:hypothetical protein
MTRRADSRWLSALLHLWVLGSFVGAAVVLLGSDHLDTIVIVAFAVFVIGPTVEWAVTGRTTKQRNRAIEVALSTHEDPGSELRAAVDEAARRALGTSVRTRWLMGVAMTGIAVACFGLALHRGDVLAALPALSFATLGVLADMGWRKEQDQARRWVEDPPVPVAADD